MKFRDGEKGSGCKQKCRAGDEVRSCEERYQ